MKTLAAVVTAALLLGGCALRPRYRDVVSPPEAFAQGDTVALRVVDAGLDVPVKGAAVSFMDGEHRVRVLSDAEGVVRLPFTPDIASDNPIVEVVLPAGVMRYRLEHVAPEAPASAPQSSDTTP